MCGGYEELTTAEEYRTEYSEYNYTKFTKVQNGREVVAYLIDDPQDDNLYTKFDAVLEDADTLGWDTEAHIRAELAQLGFTQAEEAVHAE